MTRPRPGSRPWHRVRQFFGALRPRVTPAERVEAYAYLSPALQRVFESMMLRDQQHGVVVYRRVRAAAPVDDPALFAAALLHDCGKGRVALWQRVVHVLVGAIAPPLEARIASEAGAAWRQGFWRLLHHPGIGARIVEEAGAEADVVRMIREQDIAQPDARLALLQAADEA
jgi:hypothetical protein